jgi:hypothetical protein
MAASFLGGLAGIVVFTFVTKYLRVAFKRAVEEAKAELKEEAEEETEEFAKQYNDTEIKGKLVEVDPKTDVKPTPMEEIKPPAPKAEEAEETL